MDCHTLASSFYNHCGSRAILGLQIVNGGEKLFLFYLFVSPVLIKDISLFGTYAFEILSQTSAIKYIPENIYRHPVYLFLG